METPSWERGDLTTRQVEEVAVNAIAEIYADTYRSNQSEVARIDAFCQRLENVITMATGREMRVRPYDHRS